MTRTRRDPRAERIAKAVSGDRSRTRFDLAAQGGRGRQRRDLRAETAAQRVEGPVLRSRLDRSQRGTPSVVAPLELGVAQHAAPQTIVIDEPAFLVAVVPDAPGGRLSVHDRQLFGAARTLAGSTGGVIALIPKAQSVTQSEDDLGLAGADRIGILGTPVAAYDPEGQAAALHMALKSLSPRHVLFAETQDGGDIARRLAVRSGDDLFPDVELLSATAVARAARGKRVEQRRKPARLMSLSLDAVAPYAGAPREARAVPLAKAQAVASDTILDIRHIAADSASVPLALADFVTSAGNGITDFETFRQLVRALGATLGASRVLCDAGLMPRGAQVGASGTVLGATCYFALGIAGAPQHLQGVANCEHVIAVNTDLHAAMIERAGLAVVQDAQLVMPALLAALARETEWRS